MVEEGEPDHTAAQFLHNQHSVALHTLAVKQPG
jgi:hypothetical protein